MRGKVGINGNLVIQKVSLEKGCLQGDVVIGQGGIEIDIGY